MHPPTIRVRPNPSNFTACCIDTRAPHRLPSVAKTNDATHARRVHSVNTAESMADGSYSKRARPQHLNDRATSADPNVHSITGLVPCTLVGTNHYRRTRTMSDCGAEVSPRCRAQRRQVARRILAKIVFGAIECVLRAGTLPYSQCNDPPGKSLPLRLSASLQMCCVYPTPQSPVSSAAR